MPTQPLHHVSSQKFQNPHPSTEFWILTSGFFPNMRNEPNPTYRWRPAGITVPNYAKRTQFTPTPQPKNAKRTQFTPTPAWPTIQNAKRTQFPLPRASCLLPCPSFLRNEPNLPHAHSIHRPKNTKRTQFQHTQHLAAPYFCETNPISTPRCLFLLSPLYFLLSRGQLPAPPTVLDCTAKLSSRTAPIFSC